jgi:ubiquinone/menaquinone biosynthesis C-methylase UbiE
VNANTGSWDPTWERVFQEQEWGKYPPESLIRFIARNYYNRDRKNVRILEIGCGPGANIWYLAREGFNAYGIDRSRTAIKQAQQRLADERLTAHFKVGDILKLPYPDDYFDVVIDIACLYANPKDAARRMLREVRRVLRPSGQLFSQTFSERMYTGKNRKTVGELEYEDISDGPFAGNGFVRLTDQKTIDELYGTIFTILSVDINDRTEQNGAMRMSEYLIVCRKEGLQ